MSEKEHHTISNKMKDRELITKLSRLQSRADRLQRDISTLISELSTEEHLTASKQEIEKNITEMEKLNKLEEEGKISTHLRQEIQEVLDKIHKAAETWQKKVRLEDIGNDYNTHGYRNAK